MLSDVRVIVFFIISFIGIILAVNEFCKQEKHSVTIAVALLYIFVVIAVVVARLINF